MSWDLDDILDASGGGRINPCLIEVGRALAPGRDAAAGYIWSTGRVCATVSPDRVRIRRRRGKLTDGVHVGIEQLRALAMASSDWARHREEWAAFYFSISGYPPGFGGATYYQEPGPSGQRVTIGKRGPHFDEGEQLIGRDELVPLEPRFTNRAPAIAEIWRRGERQGPKDGTLVGLRYALGNEVFFDAKRTESKVWRTDCDAAYLEPGEEAFVAAVVDVVGSRR